MRHDPLFANATLTHAEYRQYHDGLVEAMNDFENASIRSLLSEAVRFVKSAGEVVALRKGKA